MNDGFFKRRQRARTTIEDFCCTYFPLHGLHLPHDLFRFLDVLVFVEATIYQMDELNEHLAKTGAAAPPAAPPARAGAAGTEEGGSVDDDGYVLPGWEVRRLGVSSAL